MSLYVAIHRYMPLYVATCRYMSLYVGRAAYLSLGGGLGRGAGVEFVDMFCDQSLRRLIRDESLVKLKQSTEHHLGLVRPPTLT